MQKFHNASGPADLSVPVSDLGPLAWVLDELRKSLDSASKSLRRYVRDAELARGSDLESVDSSQLRISRQQLHQSVGALEMVGFTGPALVLRGMEAAVQKFVQRPELCTEAAASKIERASFALTGYLETVLAGKSQPAIALFVQYKEVQELAGANRIHPADLWSYVWRWIDVPATAETAVALDAGTRLQFDRAALQVIKSTDATAAGSLAHLSAGIAAATGSQVGEQFTIFWRIAAAFFEAIGSGSLVADVYSKRTVSRILMQLAMHIKGDLAVSDRLAQDLLFFCAQSSPKGNVPLLDAVRTAYGLSTHQMFDYSKSPFGQFDPALLVQARKRITAAKDSWSALTAGEMNKLKTVQDQFSLIAESITKLLPQGQLLSRALNACVDLVAKSGQPPEPTMSMEVATAILYLEAGFEDFDSSDEQQAARINSLAQRVDLAREGALNQALEPWMEELYRRVSDRQTMGSVVGELKISLADVEKSMDQFFRDPQDKASLSKVPSRLTQMRGVLSVLGLDQASQAVIRMRESVEQILVTEVDDASARAAGTFDKLGNNLGALGFLIDMLSYQPVLAKKLFVYDENLGQLKPLMGRVNTPIPASEIATGPMPIALPSVAAVAVASVVATAGVAGLMATAPVAAPASDTTHDEDAELLDIFLDEAREVIQNGRAALGVLAIEPSNQSEMTTLRRAFHTLKGSSRMVGLNTFGEAGWSLEQLMNGWLADQKPASHDLCTVANQGLGGLAQWVEDIANRCDQAWSSAPFRASADALRLNGEFVPLALAFAPLIENVTATAEPVIVAHAAVIAPQLPVEFAEDVDGLFEAQEIHDAGELDTDGDANFVFDLDLPMELSAEQAGEAPIGGAGPDEEQDIDFAFELSDFAPDVQEPTTLTSADALSSVELNASESLLAHKGVDSVSAELVSADELAAFELALNEQAAIGQFEQLEHALPLGANQIDESEISFDIEAPQSANSIPGAANVDSIDFAALEAVSQRSIDEPPVDFSSSATQPMALSELPHSEPSISGFEFDLSGFTAAAAATAAAAGLRAPAASAAGAASPASAMPAAPNYASSMPAPLASSDDQYKAIGPLRINLPLYNVYLNEADEWSRRLVTVLTEWSLELSQPVPNDAVAFAHSLAGSSATVGFAVLSGLARTMEHALMHLQTISEDGSYPAHQHATALVRGAEEIRHLLHQFAAGILKEPKESVALQLQRCIDAPEQATEMHGLTTANGSSFMDIFEEKKPEASVDTARAAIENIATEDTEKTVSLVAQVIKVVPSVFVPLAEPTSTVTVIAAANANANSNAASVVSIGLTSAPVEASTAEPVITAPTPAAVPVPIVVPPLAVRPPVAATLEHAHTLTVVPRTLSEEEVEEDIDAVDAIDPDLFPIFEEEAAELLPQMGSALRQWTARPTNTSARSEVLRGLHTLKGSARLAGALRLGELSHRMESAIENIPLEDAQTAQLEPLLGVLDGLQANFDRLRHPQTNTADLANTLSTAAVAAGSSNAVADEQTIAVLTNPVFAAPFKSMSIAASSPLVVQAQRAGSNQTVRVRTQLLDRMVNQAGEVIITRSRLEAELGQLRGSMSELTGNLDKLRGQLRDIEVQSESQMQSRMALAKESEQAFDPLEFDRFTRVQELTRMMAESVNDVATVQRSIQRTVEATEDDLVAQARQTRDLQRDLLRTRMVEFEGISERLYRVVRQAGKDAGKLVKLDITGGSIEMDRGVLDRMTPAFEHLLRNCVAHGIEDAAVRAAAGKDAGGQITISLHQEGNDISVEFRDDGAGLNLPRIRERAISQGLLGHDQTMVDADAANLIFTPGFTTATQVTELAGRGIGMDVVRSEVNALGGRIETSTAVGQGTNFKLVLPLTTAVTQVVMIRIGSLAIGVPANLIETVRRASVKEVQAAYNTGSFEFGGEALPFFWSGALLQHSSASADAPGKTIPIMVFRSAAQRIVAHVDEVLGNQEVVVKNLGPQLSRLPGLAGMTVLASGAVALIYNPVALASVYGEQARALSADKAEPHVLAVAITDVQARDLSGDASPVVPLVPANPKPLSSPQIPLILVVDDSITVRRVTQRLLQREGYRVSLAADGLQALERLAESELPSVILSDIEMPRMDGFDLARNIKADPRLAVLPIIMITSRIAEKHREHAMSLGVNHYLGKPYSEEELLSLIRRYTMNETAAQPI